MSSSFIQVLLALTAGIILIIILTTKYKVHAFFALLIACFLVGVAVQIPVTNIISLVKDGFGNIMRSLGLIIILGTTLGVLLEQTGSTRVMAAYILRKTGEKNAALAMSLTGFIVGMPIFCDSGYIVLSGLNQSLAKRTGIPLVIMSISLATGLYSVHCLIPPHPGAAAAAGTIGVEFGKLILIGIAVAIPTSITGYLWARYAGKKMPETIIHEEKVISDSETPSVLNAFLPVLVPIFLIAMNSFFKIGNQNDSIPVKIFSIIGDPVVALSIGVLLAINSNRNWSKERLAKILQDAAEKAGGILVIIGAGGSFGAVLAATNLGSYFSESLPLNHLGIFFPFILTFILKTAQGSSTVAIITASSIVLPLLPVLGLNTEGGKLLCVLSMGAGSMMISHANDAYFWVISKFSGLEMKTMLKVYSMATGLMGLTAFLVVYILSLFLL